MSGIKNIFQATFSKVDVALILSIGTAVLYEKFL